MLGTAAEFNSLDASQVKPVVVLLTMLGIAPAILVSLWVVYVSCFVAPRYSPELRAQRFSLTWRIDFTQTLHGKKFTFHTGLWVPLVVAILGLGFLFAVIFLLYGH
jgi:anaerobic C4-dicarboxylate transporter